MQTCKITIDETRCLCATQLQDDSIKETIGLVNVEDKLVDKGYTAKRGSIIQKGSRQKYIDCSESDRLANSVRESP